MDTDMIIFWTVVLARFIVPLFIPRFPLPAILAALIIDAVDQTIYQQFTDLDLKGYQGYDKALDIYYLSIAYLAVFRNWTNIVAINTARFLWYWRLIGVTIYEFTGEGIILLIFPNTFEYFFIWYEAMRLRWNPMKFSKKLVIGAAAAIWIFIKLPQEYWIHIAWMDTTDFIKETFFGLPPDATLSEMWATGPEVFIITGIIIVVIAAALFYLFRRLPRSDWSLSLMAGSHEEEKIELEEPKKSKKLDWLNWNVAEKIVLISFVSVIFGTVLPDVQATVLELTIAIGVIIFFNAILSQVFFKNGFIKINSILQFILMMALNSGIALIYLWVTASDDSSINITNTIFFLLLLTLIGTLYDRYRPYYDERFGPK